MKLRTEMRACDDFENFYMPVPESGCWLWLGYTTKKGYGKLYIPNESPARAHRFSYSKYVGGVPIGMHVCHKCDVPSCVNPDHLFLGNNKDNMNDRDKKGRVAFGEKAGNAKLSTREAEEIFYAIGTQSNIAKMFNVSQSCVSRIKSGNQWGKSIKAPSSTLASRRTGHAPR